MTGHRILRACPVVVIAMLVPWRLQAAEASAARPDPVQPTAEFLEYLGTLEGAEDNWTDFEAVPARPAGNGRVEPAEKPAAPAAEPGE